MEITASRDTAVLKILSLPLKGYLGNKSEKIVREFLLRNGFSENFYYEMVFTRKSCIKISWKNGSICGHYSVEASIFHGVSTEDK